MDIDTLDGIALGRDTAQLGQIPTIHLSQQRLGEVDLHHQFPAKVV
jgi:hypothetical protein